MNHRSPRPAPERQARSRLAPFISEQPFLRGSLLERARPCGKPTCRCQQGQLHRSLCQQVQDLHQLQLDPLLQRNLNASMRVVMGTLLGLAEEVRRGLGPEVRAPWYAQLARAP